MRPPTSHARKGCSEPTPADRALLIQRLAAAPRSAPPHKKRLLQFVVSVAARFRRHCACVRVQSLAVTVAWVASDTANWIFFCLGVLSAAGAASAAVFPARAHHPDWPPRPVRLLGGKVAMFSPAVVGPLLLLGGAVLVAVTAGRLSWLTLLAGAVCLAVFALVRMEKVHGQVARESRRMTAELQGLKDLQSQVKRLSTEFKFANAEVEGFPRGSGRYTSTLRVNLLELQRMLQDVVRDAVWQRDMNPSLSARLTDDLTQSLTAQLRDEFSFLVTALVTELRPLYRALDGVMQTGMTTNFKTFTQSMTAAGLWAPMSVYTSADEGTVLKDAVVRVLREFGLEVAVEEPSTRGSWWQRFWASGREVAESEPVRDRLAKLERALELEGLGKRQAEIDKGKAEAVASLYTLVKDQENAVVRLGSIVMIKKARDLVVFTVSEMQAAVLEKHSELLQDPVAALTFLHDGRPPAQDDWQLAAELDATARPANTEHDEA